MKILAKKNELSVSSILQKKIANNHENDHASSHQTNELIGYQYLADICETTGLKTPQML